jgi:hypothetical protein
MLFLSFCTPFLAGIDDCDYNLHLSNSSYPKVSVKCLSPPPPPNFLCGGYLMGMRMEVDHERYQGFDRGIVLDPRFGAHEVCVDDISLLRTYRRLDRSGR